MEKSCPEPRFEAVEDLTDVFLSTMFLHFILRLAGELLSYGYHSIFRVKLADILAISDICWLVHRIFISAFCVRLYFLKEDHTHWAHLCHLVVSMEDCRAPVS